MWLRTKEHALALTRQVRRILDRHGSALEAR
jgi:hypothetical protein